MQQEHLVILIYLGNFVRNSNALTKDLIKHGALLQLLDLVLNDKGPVIHFIFRLYLREELLYFLSEIYVYIKSAEIYFYN